MADLIPNYRKVNREREARTRSIYVRCKAAGNTVAAQRARNAALEREYVALCLAEDIADICGSKAEQQVAYHVRKNFKIEMYENGARTIRWAHDYDTAPPGPNEKPFSNARQNTVRSEH